MRSANGSPCILAWVIAIATFLAFAASPAQAQSDSDVSRARFHYEAATSYFEQGRYEDAAREFLESQRLSGRTHLLKNVAVSRERAGDFAGAIDALERYRAHPDSARERVELDERIAGLRSRLADERRRAAPLSPVEVGSALPAPGEVPAPRGASGVAEASEPEAGLDGSRRGGADGDHDAGSSSDDAAYWLLGGAGVVAVGAAVTGLLAASRANELDEVCDGDSCPPSARATRDEGLAWAWTSTGLTAAALVLGGAGLWIALGDDDGAGEERRASAKLGPGRLDVAVRF